MQGNRNTKTSNILAQRERHVGHRGRDFNNRQSEAQGCWQLSLLGGQQECPTSPRLHRNQSGERAHHLHRQVHGQHRAQHRRGTEVRRPWIPRAHHQLAKGWSQHQKHPVLQPETRKGRLHLVDQKRAGDRTGNLHLRGQKRLGQSRKERHRRQGAGRPAPEGGQERTRHPAQLQSRIQVRHRGARAPVQEERSKYPNPSHSIADSCMVISGIRMGNCEAGRLQAG